MNDCLNCHKRFYPAKRNPHQKFCSLICRRQYSYVIEQRSCPECGVSFDAISKHPNQKYCSTNCRDSARTTRISYICDNCGKEFDRHIYRDNKFDHGYCSRECYLAAHSNRIHLSCETCGVEFDRHLSVVSFHNFCGVECRQIWYRSVDRSGDNSPSWTGGHTDYRGKNWDTQRKLALLRDGYKCDRCGSEINIQVHHTTPYHTFDNYIEANDLENLATLCNICHTSVEWEYRKYSIKYIASYKMFTR